ncbi:MAG: glycosyltransferase 87 family protein, partial [Actinocatenispora sp.]
MTLTDRSLALTRRVHEAGRGTAADLGLYAVSTAFAGFTALSSTLPPHRTWGGVAVIGYAALTLLALGQLLASRFGPTRRLAAPAVRMVLVFVGWTATTLLPLLMEAAQRANGAAGLAQDEVSVVETAGARLVDTGSPYLSHDAIVQALPSLGYLAYVPYNPGIAVFGLPRRYAGDTWWTDARVGFAAVTAVALVGALLLLRRYAPATALVRGAQAVTVLPVCALTLATGGDDLPVLALAVLAMAFAARALADPYGGRGRWLVAGLVIGDAASMKLFAWPVLVILAVLAVARTRRGTASWFVVPAVAVPVLTLLPVTLRDPDGVTENLVRYPLGMGLADSPAASNFPGHLIAVLLPQGGTVAAGLLVVAGLAFAAHLVARPPAHSGA